MIHNIGVALDLDGVFFHYEKGVEDTFGIVCRHLNKSRLLMTPEEVFEKDAIYQAIEDHGKDFWTDLPLMDNAMELWHYVNSNFANKFFLTAHIANGIEDCKQGKKESVQKHFGVIPNERNFICVKSSQKKDYVNHYGSDMPIILVDDRVRNIDQWEEAGGFGILHTDAHVTINKLKELVLEHG